MIYPKTLVFLLFAVISSSILADDPAASPHWYSIVIVSGDSTSTFTGSSPFDPEEMAVRLSENSEPVALENRRAQFASETPQLAYGWHPLEPGSKVFLFPRTVLYFVALPGDPASGAK